jgi:hypothetical protein
MTGLCPICQNIRKLVRDHAHHYPCPCVPPRQCDLCFRGWICHRCNVGLGWFDDDIASLERAMAYLAGILVPGVSEPLET